MLVSVTGAHMRIIYKIFHYTILKYVKLSKNELLRKHQYKDNIVKFIVLSKHGYAT